jgi:hypothetical protein
MMELLAGVPGKLKALADRLTATRANNLDHLDADVSSRASASTAVSNAVLTDTRVAKLDNLDNIASAPARIKSIQRGTIYIAGGNTYLTISLPIAVDPNKSVVSHLGSESIGNNISNFNIGSRLELVGANQLRGWAGGDTNAIIIGYQIVEYY